MPPDSTSPADAMILVVRLARFGILCTIAVGAVLLVMEAITPSSVSGRPGFLTERTTMTVLCVIGAEFVVTVAALASLALWRR